MDNVLSAIDVPMSLFGGLNTELSPPDIPEGVSPDNQDVAFLPGNVMCRPRLEKILTTPDGTTSIVYVKTFSQPNGTTLTLYLDSTGALWQENVNTNPGVGVLLNALNAPSIYAQSVSFLGREYLAFNQGEYGWDVPRSYDGTLYNRVTQDAPGAGPLSIMENNTSVTINTIIPPAPLSIVTAVEVGSLATITVSTPHGLFPGDYVTVVIGSSGYNGTWLVQFATALTFSYQLGMTGIGSTGGGNAYSCQVTVTTAMPHGMLLFDQFTVSGNGIPLYNNNGTDGTVTAPPTWQVGNVIDATHFVFTAVNVRYGGGSGGTLNPGGQIAAGPHKCVMLWQTHTGAITAPSPPFSYPASGGKTVTFSELPGPPANIQYVIFAFTLSEGDNYFYLPIVAQGVSNSGVQQPISTATMFPATVTSVTMDFGDTTLAGGSAIDIPGNNLFEQVVLAPVLSFFAYASRLFAWGEWNNVKNFLNMGFDGGTVWSTDNPCGWSFPTTGGTIIGNQSTYTVGQYDIAGQGLGTNAGFIYQPAYQDAFGVAIIQPQTSYLIRLWVSSSAGNSGNLVVGLRSSSSGFISQAVFNTATLGTTGTWVSLPLNTPTPQAIPTDLELFVYAAMPISKNVIVDELMVVYADQPWNTTTARVSYAINPEGFDGVSGVLGSTADSNPLRCMSIIRDFLYIKTYGGFHRTQDNGSGEPDTWTVSEVSQKVGAVSFRAGDPGQFGTGDTGEGWDLTFSRSGLYIFQGGELFKISQEIQNIVDAINWEYDFTIWLKNDTVTRRCYIGVPYGTATAPNLVLVMDYRELDTAGNIAQATPVHIGFTGKMISSDLTRKWTRWSMSMNCGELLQRPNNEIEFCMGAGNGVTPGAEPSFGNFYQLTYDGFLGGGHVTVTPLAVSLANAWPSLPTVAFQGNMNFDIELPLNVSTERCAFKLEFSFVAVDDDYGAIAPYYITYFFLNHEAEIALGTGAHRKLFYFLTMFIDGNASLQKLVVSVKQHPLSPIRGYL